MEPVGIGIAGELYIGGAGVARGYLKRAGLTAQRFVADPFAQGERLYRTGDRVRYRADGNLEFLGRTDEQVKLRGYRIELGEIEAQLRRHAQVKDAVVVVREDPSGDKRLVGYVTHEEGVELDVQGLRAHLGQQLPQYMVPSVLVVLERMPLTANGKVDRRALPAPDDQRALTQEYVAPRTPLEAALAQIWSQVLKVERVGVHDNFFDLGGHSLLATRVTARIRETMAIEVALQKLFHTPTIAELAIHIVDQLVEDDADSQGDDAGMSSVSANTPASSETTLL